MFAVVDTGPLYAAVDANDEAHEVCVRCLEDPKYALAIPALVVAETCYLIGSRLGAKVEARFLQSLRDMDVTAPEAEDWSRIAQLTERYANVRLGGVDASVVALAERLRAVHVITLDHRHFATVRPRHVRAFQLLPA